MAKQEMRKTGRLRTPEMKFVGKPYEGKLHVRFEEGEWAKIATLYSTIMTFAFANTLGSPAVGSSRKMLVCRQKNAVVVRHVTFVVC